jgi:Na+-driven multidrug efflux pump
MAVRQRTRLIINVLSSYLQFFVYGLVNIVLVGYLAAKLGKDGFGIICLAMSMISIPELIGSSVCQAISKYMSAAVAKKESNEMNALYINGLVWLIIYAVLGTMICLYISFNAETLFNIPQKYVESSRLCFGLIALRILLMFPLNIYQSVLYSYQRYDLKNLFHCLMIIVRLLFIVLWFEFVSR